MNDRAEPLIRFEWVVDHLDDIWARTVEHLQLTGIAIAVGSIIAFVLAMIALRYRRTYAPITAVASILYTIPSLALFTLLVSYTGLTRLTAEIGLVSYTLVILVRSIVVGVDGVPNSAREAGIAMGYTRGRLFRDVELPLALPTIISGLRVCTVTIVGLVTVTAIIGQGGYGALILDGFRRDFDTPLLVGSILSVVLALVLDVALLGAERALTPWTRKGRG